MSPSGFSSHCNEIIRSCLGVLYAAWGCITATFILWTPPTWEIQLRLSTMSAKPKRSGQADPIQATLNRKWTLTPPRVHRKCIKSQPRVNRKKPKVNELLYLLICMQGCRFLRREYCGPVNRLFNLLIDLSSLQSDYPTKIDSNCNQKIDPTMKREFFRLKWIDCYERISLVGMWGGTIGRKLNLVARWSHL